MSHTEGAGRGQWDQQRRGPETFDEALEIIDEIRDSLMKAGRTGVVNPELAVELGSAHSKLIKADPRNPGLQANDRNLDTD